MKISQEAVIASSIGITVDSLICGYSASKFFTKNPRLSLIAWGVLGMCSGLDVVNHYSALKYCNSKTTAPDYLRRLTSEQINLIYKASSILLPPTEQKAVIDTLNKLNDKAKDILNPPKNS